MTSPLVKTTDLMIGYNGRPLLPPISFEVKPGQIVSVVGHNGSGKSTLLKTLLGILPPLGGTFSFSSVRRAYVPQREMIDPIYPVRVVDVCGAGRYIFRRPGRWLKAEDHVAIDRALETMGMAAHKKRLFRTLSGGEQQRTLMARALCQEPEVMILDEPVANMDHRAATTVMQTCQELARSRGVSILMVNHMVDVVAEISDVVVKLDRDEQRVVVDVRHD